MTMHADEETASSAIACGICHDEDLAEVGEIDCLHRHALSLELTPARDRFMPGRPPAPRPLRRARRNSLRKQLQASNLRRRRMHNAVDARSLRGFISLAPRRFCFPCIVRWAEIENRCPFCKARFRGVRRKLLEPASPAAAGSSPRWSAVRELPGTVVEVLRRKSNSHVSLAIL